MSRLGTHIDNILRSLITGKSRQEVIDKVDDLAAQGREIHHDLKNIQMRTDALQVLVKSMRGGQGWREENKNDSTI